jgi:hypothetical protein
MTTNPFKEAAAKLEADRLAQEAATRKAYRDLRAVNPIVAARQAEALGNPLYLYSDPDDGSLPPEAA